MLVWSREFGLGQRWGCNFGKLQPPRCYAVAGEDPRDLRGPSNAAARQVASAALGPRRSRRTSRGCSFFEPVNPIETEQGPWGPRCTPFPFLALEHGSHCVAAQQKKEEKQFEAEQQPVSKSHAPAAAGRRASWRGARLAPGGWIGGVSRGDQSLVAEDSWAEAAKGVAIVGEATAPASPGFDARRCGPWTGRECDFAAVNRKIGGRGAAGRTPPQRGAAQRSAAQQRGSGAKGSAQGPFLRMVRMSRLRGRHGEWRKTAVGNQAVRHKRGAVACMRELTWSPRGRACRCSPRSWLPPSPPAPGGSASRQRRGRGARLLRARGASTAGSMRPGGVRHRNAGPHPGAMCDLARITATIAAASPPAGGARKPRGATRPRRNKSP